MPAAYWVHLYIHPVAPCNRNPYIDDFWPDTSMEKCFRQIENIEKITPTMWKHCLSREFTPWFISLIIIISSPIAITPTMLLEWKTWKNAWKFPLETMIWGKLYVKNRWFWKMTQNLFEILTLPAFQLPKVGELETIKYAKERDLPWRWGSMII